jgi:hypothetical protein
MHRRTLSSGATAGTSPGVLGVAALALVTLALSACGPPTYSFRTTGTNELVLKIPRAWTEVRSGVPTGADGQKAPTGNWLAFFDAAPRPSAAHVQSPHAVAPAAIMASAAVTKEDGGSLTDDDLRDQLLPVSAGRRQAALLGGFTGTDFRLISDEQIRTRTAHGVHVVFTYDQGEGPEIYDQVAVTDSRKTRIHVFLVHCTQACYDSNRTVIAETVRSFTVKIA